MTTGTPPISSPTPPTPRSIAEAMPVVFWGGVAVVAVVVAFFVGQLFRPNPTASVIANPSVSAAASPTPSASTAPTASSAPTASPAPTPRPAAIAPPPAACAGACGNSNGYTLTLNYAERNAPPGPYTKPEPGNHLVIVTMTFKNGSKDTQSPDSFCCRVTDSLGVTRSETFSTAAGCDSWQGVELAPGASLGPKNMCFEAGGDPNARLILVWSPSFFATDVRIPF